MNRLKIMRSLRARLILSHILPLLVIIPLIGIALAFLFETQVLLAGLSSELEREALLVAAVASDYPQIWFDRELAQAFTTRIGERLAGQVMLLGADGTLLASTDPADQSRLGQQLDVPGLREALLSGTAVRVNYGERPGLDRWHCRGLGVIHNRGGSDEKPRRSPREATSEPQGGF